MNSFFRAICQMGIFMICAQAIIHFRPNGSYEKYLKMLVSTMILVQIFLPVSRLLTSGTQEGLEERIAMMEEEIEKSMEEAQKTAVITDEMLNKMTLDEVKTRLDNMEKEQIEAEKNKELQTDADYNEKISVTKDDNHIEEDSQSEHNLQERKEDQADEDTGTQPSQGMDEDSILRNERNEGEKPALSNVESSPPEGSGDRKKPSEESPGIVIDRIEVRIGGEKQEEKQE